MSGVNLLVLLLVSVMLGSDGLRITKMTVPKFVKNGTEESIVLDCEYEYDVELDKRLVVKWFHDDDPNPVYQWIPEYNSVFSSVKFGDRINKDYEVSSGNRFTKRRALNILWPTTELSGVYSCHVTSLAGLDSKGEPMVVYAHPTDIHLNYSVTDEMVKVMCNVVGVFPIPEISMFQIGPGKVDPAPVDDVVMEHELDEDETSYNVILSTNLTEEELQTDTLRYFGCIVSIPGTSYNETKKLPYFPAAKAEKVNGDPDYDDDDDDDNGSSIAHPFFMLTVVTIIVSRLVYRRSEFLC